MLILASQSTKSKMMKILQIYPLGILLLISACDLFPIPYTSPNVENKIVVNALLSMKEGLEVHLSKPLPLNDTIFISPDDQFINDAIVLFYENAQLVDTLKNINANGEYRLDDSFDATVGYSYHIEIEHPIYDNVYSSSVLMPSKPIIDNIITLTSRFSNHQRIGLTIKDISNEDNFYSIMPYAMIDSTIWSKRNINFDSYSIEDKNCGLSQETFPDICFTNDTIYLEAIIIKEDTFDLKLELNAISESYYNYSTSFYRGLDLLESAIAEPKLNQFNINGGFGVFAVVNQEEKLIH